MLTLFWKQPHLKVSICFPLSNIQAHYLSAPVQQNKILESKIQRRISRVVVKKKSTGLLNAPSNTSTLAPPADTLLGTSAGLSSLGTSVGMFPSSLGPSSSHGPPIFLRIRIASAADEPGHVSTTIQAYVPWHYHRSLVYSR